MSDGGCVPIEMILAGGETDVRPGRLREAQNNVRLNAFEDLVLSQQPATKPWTSVTPYDIESRREAEGKHPRLVVETFYPGKVIDAGCGPDGVFVHLLREQGVYAIGFDKHAQSLIALDGDITEDGLRQRYGYADLVICREVLEHLTIQQIRQAVTNLCKLSSKYVYVTTRFAKAPQSLLDVDTSDDLDPTHISMLNQDLLRVLFVLEGFKRRADLEAKMDWQQKGRVLVYERVA